MTYDTLWWMVPEIKMKLNNSRVEIAIREMSSGRSRIFVRLH